MYQFSRSIYRTLARDVVADSRTEIQRNREKLLRACESAVERLASDRHYFARPAKTLFNDVRVFFPMSVQQRVYRVIDCHMNVAREFFTRQALHGLDIEGNPLQCRATTRKGKPCQRVPLPHNGYCPSHQHLAETEELEPALAA